MDFKAEYVMLIDGKLLKAERAIQVINPATGSVFAEAPDCSSDQLDEAVEAATRAFRS